MHLYLKPGSHGASHSRVSWEVDSSGTVVASYLSSRASNWHFTTDVSSYSIVQFILPVNNCHWLLASLLGTEWTWLNLACLMWSRKYVHVLIIGAEVVLKLYWMYIKPNQLMDTVALTVLWYLDLFEIHYILKGNLIY